MTEELNITIQGKDIVPSKNIIIYSTDEEMGQLREILARIGKRYRNDEIPSLNIPFSEETEKGYQTSCNLSDSTNKTKNQQQFTTKPEEKKVKIENKKEILELEDLLTLAEGHNEKAEAVINDLEQGYFSLDNEIFINCYHENAKIKCRIAQDYIYSMKETLSNMIKIIEGVFYD